MVFMKFLSNLCLNKILFIITWYLILCTTLLNLLIISLNVACWYAIYQRTYELRTVWHYNEKVKYAGIF